MVRVRLPYGYLKGSWKSSLKGRPYASFEGVPYALPPVGQYRFKETQPMQPWDGTWDATRRRSACTQYETLFLKKIIGKEDCLFVNVFTPTLTPDEPLPVVVGIHGGGLVHGQGIIQDPSFLMDRDLVVVTLNFRLGPLGFLSTGDEVIPGNNGLKDQSAALHWIRNNIHVFGGNPENVTLIGCSSGAACVYYHYLSPLSRGTFHRGIALSSSDLSSSMHSVKPEQTAKALATIVGCPSGTSHEFLDCLQSKPAVDIVKAQIEMFNWKFNVRSPFLPTTEAIGTKNPFLSIYPYHAACMGAIANVPLLTSTTSDEGLFPGASYHAKPGTLTYLEDHWEKMASEIFRYSDTLPLNERANVAKEIKKHYFGNKPVSEETFPNLVEALGDRLYKAEVGRMAQIHALKTKQPVYVYRYSFQGTTSLTNVLANNRIKYGVCHGDDFRMIFKFTKPGQKPTDPGDLAMIDVLVNMVYTYASTGVPSLTDNGPQWTPIKPGASEIDYLEIMSPSKFEMRSVVDLGQRSFWDGLGFNENERYRGNDKDEL